MPANYRAIAVDVGDAIKRNSSINEINRAAGSLLRIQRQSFPNEAITSERAKLVHDWVLSLAREKLEPEERDRRLVQFCLRIAAEADRESVQKVLRDAGIGVSIVNKDLLDLFSARQFHPTVSQHSKKLFLQGNFFHAVFEAAKVYNVGVKKKAQSGKDGEPLMLDVLSAEKGVLKVTACVSETDRNVQDGVKFLSAGLMRAIRNPTAHEPALDWPIQKEDALDVLSFISFLFRQLDRATYFKPQDR